MPYSLPRYTFLFLLLGVAFLTTWHAWDKHHFIPQFRFQTTKNYPDWFMKDINYESTDHIGQLHSTLEATEILHYQKKNLSAFSHPAYTVYSLQNPPIRITANHAEAMNGEAQINLWDHVVIHQNSTKTHQEFRLLTNQLIITPKTQYATTTQPVTIIQPNLIIHAIGMKAWKIPDERIEFLSHAKGQYLPKTAP